MGWRQRYKRKYYPWYVTYGCIWNSIGEGRFWKRKLSKARRRAFKQGREWRDEWDSGYRGQHCYESNCNFKMW